MHNLPHGQTLLIRADSLQRSVPPRLQSFPDPPFGLGGLSIRASRSDRSQSLSDFTSLSEKVVERVSRVERQQGKENASSSRSGGSASPARFSGRFAGRPHSSVSRSAHAPHSTAPQKRTPTQTAASDRARMGTEVIDRKLSL